VALNSRTSAASALRSFYHGCLAAGEKPMDVKVQFAAGDASALQLQITDNRELITKRAARF